MSQPVFGRQPSRPLPRDGDSEPTEEFEVDLTDDEPVAERPDTEPEAEPALLDDEGAEADEQAALDVEELESGEGAGATGADESAALDVEELDGEPVVLDIEDAEPAEPATPPAEPVVVDAEAVSAEPHRASGDDGAWVEIQARFVDDPAAATAGALQMLRERLDGLAPAGASTEDLRVAFRRYRAAWFDLAEK